MGEEFIRIGLNVLSRLGGIHGRTLGRTGVRLAATGQAILVESEMLATRTTLHSKTERLLSGVHPVALAYTRVSIDNWLPKFKRTRNHIAHGNGGSTTDVWTDGALLRAVRDANRVLLSLALLTHLGVPDAALERTAERLGNRYSGRHRPTGIFR
ncbi:hypothetical protein E6C70_11445 [Glaciibacter flavus]|uniref:Apea-like HEPN domain-containing protein n=1 Tax=Orlajensenia flava TaxID=2565934 RepID=A0A4V3WU01_9MICO|nr:HEPN domain-containing protein [Glaciibacter flavus]THG34027.1 hypothetical protein E6C70_11445 [Glaciibacter flavus]